MKQTRQFGGETKSSSLVDRLWQRAPTSKWLGRLHETPESLNQRFFSQPVHNTVSSQLPQASTMASSSQRPTGRDDSLSRLNLAIDALSRAKDISGVALAQVQAPFSSVYALLTVIRVSFVLLRGNGSPVHVSPGLCAKRRGLRRVRVELCRHLRGT